MAMATIVTSHLDELLFSGRKWSTLYVDPPWQYANQGTRSATDRHYQTMSIEDIAALPVAQLSDDEAHLHIWTTNAFLFRTEDVIRAWGFEYKSMMVWVKPQLGIGNYWRVGHEFMLLGTKGGLAFRDHAQRSVIEHDRLGHSKKPYAFRRAIEIVSPAPYLELFAREEHEGWSAWGNEIGLSLFSSQLRKQNEQAVPS